MAALASGLRRIRSLTLNIARCRRALVKSISVQAYCLKGQDFYKLIFILLLVVGALIMTLGILIHGEPYTWISDILKVRSAGG